MNRRRFQLTAILLLLLRSGPVSADALNIAYGDDPKQRLDVYAATRDGAIKDLPVVIWVHGGGWRTGDKDNRSGTKLCKIWATTGIVTVNLNYRLTPDVVHPAHVEDIAAGIAWVHKNIEKHGGDPKKVYLLGHSAGAHLVALVATNPKYLKVHELTPKTALAGVMSIDTASYDLNATRSPIVRKMIQDAFGDDHDTLTEASPLPQAKQNRDSCPPFIIATVRQRREALRESVAFDNALPKSKLIEMDYPESGQLKAHAQIAIDLMDLKSSMTKQLLSFVGAVGP